MDGLVVGNVCKVVVTKIDPHCDGQRVHGAGEGAGGRLLLSFDLSRIAARSESESQKRGSTSTSTSGVRNYTVGPGLLLNARYQRAWRERVERVIETMKVRHLRLRLRLPRPRRTTKCESSPWWTRRVSRALWCSST